LWGDLAQQVVYYATSINEVLMKVPKSATSVSQPADLAWNFLRQVWHEDMQGQIAGHRVAGKKFKLKTPDRANICG
jgi:hypothetical protein